MQIDARFKLDSLIGEGGMAKVYRVYDGDLQKTCALKLSRYPDDKDDFDKTLSEATLWFKFRKFAHVVEVYEIIRFDDSRLGILMEYMNGGNLRSLMSQEVPLNDRYLALFDVSSAIINCCSVIPSFCHLDIKPENCLRTQCGLTKLSDFGISCYANSGLKKTFSNKQDRAFSLSLPIRTNSGIRCAGTPLYMAPEQITGVQGDRHKADVYSFGILALEVLSGVHPLQEINALDDIFRSHIQGISKDLRRWPDSASAKLIRLLDRAISPDPSERPAMCDINECLQSAYVGSRMMVVSGLEKLPDPIEDALRKGKSLWAMGRHEAAVSVIKSNLEADPFQADLWYYLAKIEFESLSAELTTEQLTDQAARIAQYSARAILLDDKFSQKTHEDYDLLHAIIPSCAAQKDDRGEFKKWLASLYAKQDQWLEKQDVRISQSGGPVRCLCVRCGEVKMNILKRCSRCGFLPTDMKDLYHTYRLRVEAVCFSEGEEEAPFSARMNALRYLGRNIKSTIADLVADDDYLVNYGQFERSIGKELCEMVRHGPSKEEMASVQQFRRVLKKNAIIDKLKKLFLKR